MPEPAALILTAAFEYSIETTKKLIQEPKAVLFGFSLTTGVYFFQLALVPLRRIYLG